MHDNINTAMNAEQMATTQSAISQFLTLRVNHETTFKPVSNEAKAKMVFTGTHSDAIEIPDTSYARDIGPNAPPRTKTQYRIRNEHVKPTELVFEAVHPVNQENGIYNAVEAFAKHDIVAREAHPKGSGRLVLVIDTAQEGFADKLATLFQNEGPALVETARFNAPAVTGKLAETIRTAIPSHSDGQQALNTDQAAELGHAGIQAIRQVVANAGGTFRLRELQKAAQKAAITEDGKIDRR